jgi:NADPH-dependent 2,4-dienoyl-CoA reductase/sulfur reductase-like enzyme
LIATLSALGLAGLFAPSALTRAAGARLVVVGGGFGGATAARFAKRLLPGLAVTLVEPNEHYVACPFSNLVVAGLRTLEQQTFSYQALAGEGIAIVRASARDIDPAGKTVTLDSGQKLAYDRLILAPGIDFRWETLQGYGPQATQRMPHAWKAGAQTLLLQRQLQAMDDGGVVAMSVTAAPFRCPPGPYERASLIAAYLARHKPRSKLIILDANERFSKQPLFMGAWESLYGDRLEWRSASNDGRVTRVEPDSLTLHTDFDAITAAVVNIVPPQQAGLIARRCGAADDSGWCPIDAASFESRLLPDIHVIGDAVIAAPMPKSAFSANAQAKVCAIQVARLFTGLESEPTTLANTCYSYIANDRAISVSGVYSSSGGRFASVEGAGGISPLDAPVTFQQREAAQARDWFRVVTGEAFGG